MPLIAIIKVFLILWRIEITKNPIFAEFLMHRWRVRPVCVCDLEAALVAVTGRKILVI